MEFSQFETASRATTNGVTPMQLSLHISDPVVLGYLSPFEENLRPDKAVEALKVSVIAIQSASPSLDTRVVQKEFGDFVKEMNGILESQIGPTSTFGKVVNPDNKKGLIALIENTVRILLETNLTKLLNELKLDDEGSAMSRLKAMLANSMGELKQALKVQQAKDQEAERGHVKGFDFQADLYERVAEWGQQLGDETEFVANIPAIRGRKLGDHLITLGETTGAPGVRLVVEAKEQPYKLKAACDELQRAKEIREATYGIFVFAKGCEPTEVEDFRKVGEDFYCTADKEVLKAGGPLVFFEAAYKIARAQAVFCTRKEEAGEIDLDAIQQHISALIAWVERMSEITTKATTVKNNGIAIEKLVGEMKDDMEGRLKDVLELLRLGVDGQAG